MGNLISGLGDKKASYEIFLDFENARPTPEEQETYDKVHETVQQCPSFLEELENFDGCAEEIKLSIANPNDASLEENTWQALSPRIKQLLKFYEFSATLVEVTPLLLKDLCCEDPASTLESKQSLAKLLAEIFYYVLRFDELKMGNSSVQNVFPYYRRLLDKKKKNGNNPEIVADEVVNKMCLFYASLTPMLTVITDCTTKFVKNGGAPTAHVSQCLCCMATVCKDMVDNPEFEAKLKASGNVNFVLRVMVAVVVLYDHVDPIGAFSKKSMIDIRGIIRVLKDPTRSATTESLVNALRYRTKHANDDDTPKAVKQMLEF